MTEYWEALYVKAKHEELHAAIHSIQQSSGLNKILDGINTWEEITNFIQARSIYELANYSIIFWISNKTSPWIYVTNMLRVPNSISTPPFQKLPRR